MSKDTWLFNKGEQIDFPIPDGVDLPIYVIGDSHVRVLTDVAPNLFKSSQTDIEEVFESKSAYAVGSNGHDYYLKEALRNIPDNSQALLSFGEIDCRHYLPNKAHEQNTTIEYQVDKMIERYTSNCVRLLKEKFRVMILGAYICPDDHNHSNRYEDILEAKTLFNEKIEKYCYQEGLLYIPLFKVSLRNGWDRCGLVTPTIVTGKQIGRAHV